MTPIEPNKPRRAKRGPEPLRLKIDDLSDSLTRIMRAGKPTPKQAKKSKRKP